MSELLLLPDAETLLVAFLRAQPEVESIVSSRVFVELPMATTWPLLRVRRVGGTPVRSKPLHLDAPLLQVEGYASNKPTARHLTETARAVIALRLEGMHDEGNVSGVELGNLAWLPDEDFEPPQPRYVADVTIFTHL